MRFPCKRSVIHFCTSSLSKASRRRVIWSSTNAFIGYIIRALTAASRFSLGRCIAEDAKYPGVPCSAPCGNSNISCISNGLPSFAFHHRFGVYATGCFHSFSASWIMLASIGSKNDSVLPEPVPEVITHFFPSNALRNISAWCWYIG